MPKRQQTIPPKIAYYYKILGIDIAREGGDRTVVSFIDFSEGFHEPPCKHVESKEVPWDTPLIEGE